jgi:NAD(P)-dependent dehydrogenase (short-subunit alcohol dehydrogenase family)
MTNPTILITGASRGLGLAAARDAAALGANVVMFARSAEKVKQEAQAIQEKGGRVLAVVGDVSDWEDCQHVIERTIAQFDSLDALVNNAGVITPIAPIASADVMAWRENLEINLLGPMMLTQAALPYLRQHRGRVINVSSGAATYAVPGWGAYCVAKGGLNQFNRVLAVEEEMITSISFRPGVVDTDMQAIIREMGGGGMPTAAHERFVRMREAGELLPPEAPGGVLAVIALYAPPEWDGAFISWDEERAQELVRMYGTG